MFFWRRVYGFSIFFYIRVLLPSADQNYSFYAAGNSTHILLRKRSILIKCLISYKIVILYFSLFFFY